MAVPSFVPVGETGYLTARYRGQSSVAKPILVLGHMDVVEAKREDWQRDPFTAVIENGYVFGRGASDMKGDLSMVVAALITSVVLADRGSAPAPRLASAATLSRPVDRVVAPV